MVDTTSTWYNSAKDPQATFFGGMLALAIIDSNNYQKFLEPGQPSIWDDESNPMDIMGRPGLFLLLLKEGVSFHLNSPLLISYTVSICIHLHISTSTSFTCT